MLFRALLRTHHMTSRKKVAAVSKAAKKFDCAVYLKTGVPGVMIAECGEDGKEGLAGWVAFVKVCTIILSVVPQCALLEMIKKGRLFLDAIIFLRNSQ